MRVSGVKETSFGVWVNRSSPRVFFRCGFQRYAATPEEAIEFARLLVAAIDALNDGREYAESHIPGGGDDDSKHS